jgi:hypothetical protein
MRSFMIFAALPLLASAWTTENILLSRSTSGNSTSCSSSDQACGAFCIPSDYTCCPDLEGGCSADTLCQKGSNGIYGCCPEGETCTGEGGSEFIDGASPTSSSSVAVKTTSALSGAEANVLSQGLVVVAAAGALFFGL